MGEPAEIAAVAHLLASDEAGFTTGQVYGREWRESYLLESAVTTR